MDAFFLKKNKIQIMIIYSPHNINLRSFLRMNIS